MAEIALDLGMKVSGSDPVVSPQTETLSRRSVTVNTDQDGRAMAALHRRQPIDWFVYTSALPDDNGELEFARKNGIRFGKRHQLLGEIIRKQRLQLIAVAGTHGKTTTTAMLVWLFGRLGQPVAYSVGASLSFGPSGRYQPGSRFFIYECDEYDRNFLHFHPRLSVITSLDYDHPDSYPSPNHYRQAFRGFLSQSDTSLLWQNDADYLNPLPPAANCQIYPDESDLSAFRLAGSHNRRNAYLAAQAAGLLLPGGGQRIIAALNDFPGTSRRFEKLADNLYSDYAHHPKEIAATLQLASELSDEVVAVYQPHQNVRQHVIGRQYADCFGPARKVYWLPTYLSREDKSLEVLTPDRLTAGLPERAKIVTARLDDRLWREIKRQRGRGRLVVAMSAGDLDVWLRQRLAREKLGRQSSPRP